MQENLRPVKPATTRMRSHRLRIYIGLISLCFAILTVGVKVHPFWNIDLVITRAIQQITWPVFGILMNFLTELGNPVEATILPILILIFLFLKKRIREATMLLTSVVGVIIISETLKQVVARPRPNGQLIIQVGHFVRHDSFPSGHVLFFIGFFGMMAYLVYTRLQKNWLTRSLVMIFLLMILLIGFSRIYLGAHWFSDVLGSYLIGSVWLYAVAYFMHRLKC